MNKRYILFGTALATAAIIIIVTITVLIMSPSISTPFNTIPDSNMPANIRIAYFPNVGHLIPIVGLQQQIFQAHLPNTTIHTRLFDSGPQIIESLFADSVDIAYVGPGPAINGFLNSNHKIKILSGAASGGASFIVHPDSFTTNNFDMDSKKIAAPQIGNTQDVSLRSYLHQNDLSTTQNGGSVSVYNIPNPDIYTLFVKGDIDGAWVAEPWATILEQELGGIRLFHEEDIWPGNDFSSVVLIGNVDYIKKNPHIIDAWIQAHNSASIQVNADKSKAGQIFNDFIHDTFGKKLDQDIVDTAISNIRITPDIVEDSIPLFAKRADQLGYLGRDGYDLSGIFYMADLQSGIVVAIEEEKEEGEG